MHTKICPKTELQNESISNQEHGAIGDGARETTETDTQEKHAESIHPQGWVIVERDQTSSIVSVRV